MTPINNRAEDSALVGGANVRMLSATSGYTNSLNKKRNVACCQLSLLGGGKNRNSERRKDAIEQAIIDTAPVSEAAKVNSRIDVGAFIILSLLQIQRRVRR